MFTDSPATPARVEVLVDLLVYLTRAQTREAVTALLQPDGVPGKTEQSTQARDTLQAARELGVVSANADGKFFVEASKFDTRSRVQAAIDVKVLSARDIEPYFALFYSFALGQSSSASLAWSDKEWANEFNKKLFPTLPTNPFNSTKLTGLRRWLVYAGLGWDDPMGTFQPLPLDRLRRALPKIFDGKRQLDSDRFARALGECCAELDGGAIFHEAQPDYDPRAKQWTRGVAASLVELHLDGVIRLNCPADSEGWSIASAEPPLDAQSIQTTRVSTLELLTSSRGAR